MWKKTLLLFTLFAFAFTFAGFAEDTADAKRGGFSSGVKSYNKTPAKSTPDSAKSGTTAKSSSNAGTAAQANKGGLFGGSFMKGMMLGGLAGLLFGSLFAGMGFLGNLLGLLVNVLAIVALVVLVRLVWNAFSRKKDEQRPQYPNNNNRGW